MLGRRAPGLFLGASRGSDLVRGQTGEGEVLEEGIASSPFLSLSLYFIAVMLQVSARRRVTTELLAGRRYRARRGEKRSARRRGARRMEDERETSGREVVRMIDRRWRLAGECSSLVTLQRDRTASTALGDAVTRFTTSRIHADTSLDRKTNPPSRPIGAATRLKPATPARNAPSST